MRKTYKIKATMLKSSRHDIFYVSESEISTEIIANHFYDMTELPDSCYEVEKTKKKINLEPSNSHPYLYLKLCQASNA